MSRDDTDEDGAYVIIEEASSDLGPFLLGAAIGAGLALLLAPRSGSETRAVIGQRARAAGRAAGDAADGVAGRVSETFAEAREELERRIESARAAVKRRTQQLAEAVAEGRAAARNADVDIRPRRTESASTRPVSSGGAADIPARPDAAAAPPSTQRAARRRPPPGESGEPRSGTR